MTNDKKKPARTLRDGSIKAVIWRNDSDKGAFYSVNFARSYKDGDDWKETDSFSGSEILRVAHLAHKAYDAIAKLKADDRSVDDEENGGGA